MRCKKKQISVFCISIVLGSLSAQDLQASALNAPQQVRIDTTHTTPHAVVTHRDKPVINGHAGDYTPDNHLTTCAPCRAHSDCQIQNNQALCLSYGDQGSFCGASCSTDTDCPSNRFDCLALSDPDSQQVIGQCVIKPVMIGSASGTCTKGEHCPDGQQCLSGLCGRWRPGRCPCSTWATRVGLRTTCHRVNDFGRCAGTRFCDTDGLTDCSAPEPQPERCDNIDNDCDGKTDEGLTSSCTLETSRSQHNLVACTQDRDCPVTGQSCNLNTNRCQAGAVKRHGIQSCEAGVWTCRATDRAHDAVKATSVSSSRTKKTELHHVDWQDPINQQATSPSYARSSISFIKIKMDEPTGTRNADRHRRDHDLQPQARPSPTILAVSNHDNRELESKESFSWVRSGTVGEGSLLLNSNGRVWTRHYGWLDERFQAKGHYARADQRCPAGHFVQGFNTKGEQICAPLSTIAGTFALSDQRCPAGSFQRGVSAAGTPLCTSKLLADLDADGHRLKNIATPTSPGDAANKAYVDQRVSEVGSLATGSRVFTGVIALRRGDCPAGWTTDWVEKLKGRDGKVYVALSRNGLYLGGLNAWGHGNQRLTVNFRQGAGPTKVCSRQFHASSGNPHVSMIFSANGQCPNGYLRWSTNDELRGDNGWAYAVTSDAGFYLGYVDSWSASDQSKPQQTSYSRRWFQSSQAAATCVKVMGVDEEPDKQAGVFTVFVGVKGPLFCPNGWLYQPTTELAGSDGQVHIQANRHASMLGASYGREHGGGAYQYVRLSQAHAHGVCSRYFEVRGQPYANVRTPNQGDCPNAFASFQAHAVKGDDGVGYAQLAAKTLYIGGLDQWQRSDKDAGYWHMTLASELTHKLCLAIDDKQSGSSSR